MPRPPASRRVLPAILLALAAGAVWWALGPDPDLPGPSATADPNAAVMPAQAHAASSEPQPVRTAANRQDAHDAAATPDAGATLAAPLRVRLRGLHGEAPWTGEVRFEWQGNDDTAETGYRVLNAASRPDPQGAVEFALPAWFATARNQQGSLRAEDPNYRPVELRLEGPLDLTREIVLDVQVVAVLEGRVVTSRGEPVVAARLIAFPREGAEVADQRVGQCNTREDGGYRLRVPPGAPMLIVAAPMANYTVSGPTLTWGDGGVVDSGAMRDDFLPAAVTVQGRIGAPTAVPDLVLADAVDVRGTVRWDDGSVVPHARVWIQPRGSKALGLTKHLGLQITHGLQPAPVTSAPTDEQGRFRLPAVPGLLCDLRVQFVEGCEVIGEHPTVEATPGRDVELRIHNPVVLRVFHAGLRAPKATIESEVKWPQSATGWLRLPILKTDENGELRAVSVHPALRVRAVSGARQSPWTEIATAPARTIDLQLEDTAVGELLVEFTGEHPVRNASFGWTRDDGTKGRQQLQRDDSSGPFRLRLAPGHYRLRIGPAAGERNGEYLLPIERDVEITEAPQPPLTLPAAFGGRFTVFATDSRGLYVAGTCRVLDADGGDRSAQFVVRDGGQGTIVGAPGDLLAGGPNEFGRVLLPGDYLLDFGFPEHGALQRRISIAALEVTEVRIRLP